MFKKVSTSLDFASREKKILEYWKDKDIFRKSIKIREGCPAFTFYDGPPTANGKPHIGHIITRAIKDIIPRYKTMKGFKVLRKAGWDTHGLPVELEVEKDLGINGKPDIERYGVEPFINKCKQSVWRYENEWRKMSERVGFWADMDNPYVTYHNSYIESVWWALKQIWDKGLIYKGHKVVPYCPRCGTALSSHEVAQGYKDVKEPSIYVKFRIKGEQKGYFLAWTTTPWTLPSNVSLTINPDEKYARVKCGNEEYILAEALVEAVTGGIVIDTFPGKKLLGMEYEPLFNFAKPESKAYYITPGDFVTLTEGTGIVHTAPAFGEDDSRVGRENDLPFVQMVDEQGRFVDAAEPWKGVFVKDADPEIIKWLEHRGLVFKKVDYEHSYPFCWRCDTHLLYYARDTWFIKMTELREQLLNYNQKINWLPDNIKEGRFGNFLENVVDWGLSRERYWGTPLPIWECGCGHRHMIGSIDELKKMGVDVADDIELHKPYIDRVLLNCPECAGGKMKRVPEVIDCWFDSGSMPFAQWHYPFENKEIFEENFPADFISEAIDQTRGWFYTLHAISTILFEGPSYMNCIVIGHVQDKEGQKMSKHKGNVIDPWTVLDKQGADAVRWYFYSGSSPWLPSRFYEDAVNEVQRKFMGTLWNTYAFFVLYSNIDNFNPAEYKLEYQKLHILDKWILSRLHSLIRDVDGHLGNYSITEPARMIQDFIDDLSNWYVRRSRERFWQGGMPQDKINAYMTLYTVLVGVAKLIAPFTPFMAEEIYINLVAEISPDAPESVHLADFPECDASFINEKLEYDMANIMKVIALGRACRNKANIKNRQPVKTIFVKAPFKVDSQFESIISDELNIKEMVFTSEIDNFKDYRFKPQLKTVGPRYGRIVPAISEELSRIDGIEAYKTLIDGKPLVFSAGGQTVELTQSDLLIEEIQKAGYVSESDKGITVVLDTNLDDALIEEGFVREIISKVQTMRKEAGFEVLDHIELFHDGNKKIAEVIARNINEISAETLTDSITDALPESGACSKQWDINGERVTLGVRRIET